MKITVSKAEEVRELTELSKKSFETDVEVDALKADGPPYYDSETWHEQMRQQGHLYTIQQDDSILGGLLLFTDDSQKDTMYLGRIFLDPKSFRKGLGIQAVKMMEDMFPDTMSWKLDTPIWNVRTNRFYKKLGYEEIKRDQYFIYYEKKMAKE